MSEITDKMDEAGYLRQCHEFTENVRDMLGAGYGLGYQLSDLWRVLQARNEAFLKYEKERDYAIRWSNKAVDDVKASYEAELANARNASWDAGYLAGFKASGEGWNGEYPFDGTDPGEDALWLERRNTYRVLAALKAEGESRTPVETGES